MKRIFLIDYENVSDSGLEGFFDLTPADTVYIFYTVKACKIGIDFVDLLRKQAECAELRFIRAATGNQALDFQLSSYLGALITANADPECSFHIISKDKGYTCLLSFWASMRPGVRLSILPRIADEARKRPKPQPAAPLPEPEVFLPAVETVQPVEAEPEMPVIAEEATEPEPNEMSVPSEAETNDAPATVEPETAEAAAPATVELSEAAPEEVAPVAEAAAAPQPQSAEAKPASSGRRSRRAKSASKKAASAEAQDAESAPSAPEAKQPGRKALAPADRAVMNTAVQQVLSKAKYDNAIISSAASLVIKMYKDGTNMQELYRGIIKSFGREQGLEVYNLIKPVLM